MKNNKYGNSEFMSEVEEMDESNEQNLRSSNTKNFKEANDNLIKLTHNQFSNHKQNKVSYEEFTKNSNDNEMIDLEKFYETKQQKIEDILMRKSCKNTPQYLKDPVKKSEIIYGQVHKNVKTFKIAGSPKSEIKRSNSMITSVVKKNVFSKKILPNNTKLPVPVVFTNNKNININNYEKKSPNALKRSFHSDTKENKRKSNMDIIKNNQPKAEVKLEIRHNKIYDVSSINKTVGPNNIQSTPKGKSNPCLSEKKYTKDSTNNLITQVNSSHNTFRKNFSLSLKKKEDNPMAFIKLTNLKNMNLHQAYATTPNTTKNITPENALIQIANSYVLKENNENEQENMRPKTDLDEDLTMLEKKQAELNKEIEKHLSLVKDKTKAIKDDKKVKNYNKKEEANNYMKDRSISSKQNHFNQESNPDRQQRMKVTSACSRSYVDKKYEGILKEICEKRKESKSKYMGGNNIKDSNDDVYSKHLKWKHDILDKSIMKKAMKDVDEVNECTFKPCMTENSKKMAEKFDDYKNLNIYDRSINWIKNNKEIRLLESKSKEKNALDGCLFKPTTLNQLNQDEILKIKEDNDYIYKKNVIWLQKVKENRKHLELQSEMDIKKDNVHIKREGIKRVISMNPEKFRINQKHASNENDANSLNKNTKTNQLKSFDTNIKDESSLFNEKENIINNLNSLDKDIHDIKSLFESVKSVYNKSKDISYSEEVYLKRSLSSKKVSPIKKEVFSNDKCKNTSRNNGLNKSVTTNQSMNRITRNEFSYLDKYQKLLENYEGKQKKSIQMESKFEENLEDNLDMESDVCDTVNHENGSVEI